MPQANVAMFARRINATTSIIDIKGEVTAFAEQVLMEAYNEACTPTTRVIILNFTELDYMNSSGIGLIVFSVFARLRRAREGVCCVENARSAFSTQHTPKGERRRREQSRRLLCAEL
jgi:anti-anti-sigma factor